jgi:hypothetical protein
MSASIVRRIWLAVLAGLGSALFGFFVGAIISGILIFMFFTIFGTFTEVGPMMVIYVSPIIGGLAAIITGIRGGQNEYKALLRNDSMKVIRNNTKINLAELRSITDDTKSNPIEIQEEELPKWKAGFIKIGWMEEIGKKTETALKMSIEKHRTKQEPLLCVTYADVEGSHITGIWFNQVNLYSSFSAFIATSKTIVLVHPVREIVQVVEYKNIRKVEINSHLPSKTYTLSTFAGDVVKIDVNFDGKDAETIIDSFFERIASAK